MADAGRPTEYTKAIEKKARHYAENFKEYGDVIPNVAGLSLALKVARSTIYLWIKDKDKLIFSDIVEEILARQESRLVNGGLDNTFNASITKLLLNKHGYHEKQETDHKSSDGSMSPPTVIEIVAKDIRKD